MKIFKIGQVFDLLQFLLHSAEKNLLNFSPITVEVWRQNHTHPNRLVWEDHIAAHRGCCGPKFLHAVENDQALLAHTPL